MPRVRILVHAEDRVAVEGSTNPFADLAHAENVWSAHIYRMTDVQLKRANSSCHRIRDMCRIDANAFLPLSPIGSPFRTRMINLWINID